MKKIVLISLVILCVVSCKKKEDEEIVMAVASEMGVGNVVGDDVPVYVVKFRSDEQWRQIPEAIIGFDYTPGYEYVIVVKREHLKNPPQDYRGAYILLRVISKTEKQTEGLPEALFRE